jgi:hypothetical protein
VLRGTRTSRLTHGVRAGAVVTLALLAGAIFTSRDARGLFAMFAVMVLSLTALGALLRRVQVGRWIF